jgi:hypothetical protein
MRSSVVSEQGTVTEALIALAATDLCALIQGQLGTHDETWC